MFYLDWNEMNGSLKIFIIQLLCKSFNKNDMYNLTFYNKLDLRFTIKKSKIGFFFDNNDNNANNIKNNNQYLILEGIVIYWKCNKFIYLDKLFSINPTHKKGIGSKMLNEYLNEQNSINKVNKIILRTDEKTSYFYIKNDMKKHIQINENYINDKKCIYFGNKLIPSSDFIWEYEDIYDLKINSCFD